MPSSHANETSAKRGGVEAASQAPYDESSRRVLNLFFTLNASRTPLTTSQIIGDSDLGYGSANPESDKRKFKRDRERLADHGIFVVDARQDGASERDEGLWTIDRHRTHAELSLVSSDDADTLIGAVDQFLQRDDVPFRSVLPSIRSSLEGISSHSSDMPVAFPGVSSSADSMLDALWTAFSLRLSIPILYTDGAGSSCKRTLSIYGSFSLDGISYLVAFDSKSRAIRTFRTDRIDRVWKPRAPYVIPADFDIRDHIFFPFDLSAADPVPARFSISKGVPSDEVESLTHGRGSIARGSDGSWVWSIPMRDCPAGAAMALEHSDAGMRPLEPPQLVAAYRDSIQKALTAHAR